VLIVVRHGQTTDNAAGLLSGRSDTALTDLGLRQAAMLAGAIGPPGRLISSPLRRARETAAAFRCHVEVDERWTELDYGELDGHAPGDVPEEVWERWRADPHFVPARGESLAAVGERVRDACREVAAQAAHRDVVVVTHVSPIKAAIAWTLGVGDEIAWRLFIKGASVCRVRTSGLTPSLLGFNEVHPPDMDVVAATS
jgi:broad specificity phosphatase PhoE